jgi:hypothetical protein
MIAVRFMRSPWVLRSCYDDLVYYDLKLLRFNVVPKFRVLTSGLSQGIRYRREPQGLKPASVIAPAGGAETPPHQKKKKKI